MALASGPPWMSMWACAPAAMAAPSARGCRHVDISFQAAVDVRALRKDECVWPLLAGSTDALQQRAGQTLVAVCMQTA